jgi:Tfp pilus assembly protein PilO
MDEFRKKLLIQLSIGMGGAILIGILLLYIGHDINKRIREIQNQRSELAFRTQNIQTLALLRSGLEKSKTYISFLENILPSRDYLIAFPKDLEEMAKQNNIDLGFSFGSEYAATPEAPGYLTFTITISGVFDDMMAFLKTVEKSRYFVNFISMDLNKRDKIYTGTLSGQVFSR